MLGCITLLTDYGTADPYAAICRGVLARLAPHATCLDVTHEIPPGDVRRGARVLAEALPWMPVGVHVAVVDPGVGSARRTVALAAGRHRLVGPDNGLLLPAAHALGGVTAAIALPVPSEASPTFHGRDVFCPAAAALAVGADLLDLGTAIDPSTLVSLPAPVMTTSPGALMAEVLGIDRFGNVQLAAVPEDLERSELGEALTLAGHPVRRARTFANGRPDELILLVDSAGRLAVCLNGARAADLLGAHDGEVMTLEGAR